MQLNNVPEGICLNLRLLLPASSAALQLQVCSIINFLICFFRRQPSKQRMNFLSVFLRHVMWAFLAVCFGCKLHFPQRGRRKQGLHLLFPVWWAQHLLTRLPVWLSVWATGKPFTAAQTAACSPSPSVLVRSALSAPSFLSLSFYILCRSLCSLHARVTLSHTLSFVHSICLSVFLSPHLLLPLAPFYFAMPDISF